ncbi:hypothetical protein LCGC14_2362480 [marine sediment metagenome]|uniref:Right handed beta helix domain-containing protein n=1 Tax=marine sediment metagenome TaxID=412755 RepID=A0A0F9C6H1_9ZZZZ
MKKSVYGLLLIYVGMVFLSSIQGIPNENNIEIDNVPQLSSYTVLDHRVHINDNWTETKAVYSWITGNGTQSDPYIIDNISIDMRNFPNYTFCSVIGVCEDYTGPAIIIENTVNYFIIQNSIISYAGGYHIPTSGIFINDARNGILLNNTFYHDYRGIYIRDSEFIQVLNNTIFGAHYEPFYGKGDAIRVYDSIDITIQHNYIEDHYSGIVVRNAAKNIIVDNNTIINYVYGSTTTSERGIFFKFVNNSAITNNTLFGMAITEHIPESSSLLRTSDNNNNMIQLDECYNILVAGNKFYDENGVLIVSDDSVNDGVDSIPGFLLSIAAFISIITTVIIIQKIRKR